VILGGDANKVNMNLREVEWFLWRYSIAGACCRAGHGDGIDCVLELPMFSVSCQSDTRLAVRCGMAVVVFCRWALM
jgi:hypothetical protein